MSDADSVKDYVATLSVDNSFKSQLVKCYGYFASVNGINWVKPVYRHERKIPKIPKREKILQVISASKKYAALFKVLYETGVMPFELSKVERNDLDADSCVLSVRDYKGHAFRTVRLSRETTAMLNTYFAKYLQIPDAYWICRMWRETRDKVHRKMQDESIKKIQLYDLRRFYATALYARTRDILLVKQQLGHKKLETTMLYTQLLTYTEDDQYTCKTAKTLEEAVELLEAGFEYVTEMDGVKLFRKRK